MTNTLSDRMKTYENIERKYLTRRMPLCLRLDIRAAHTLTRNMQKPWDSDFMAAMDHTALVLAEEVQTSVVQFVQSDEISLLLHNYKKLNSEAWFDNNLQKIVSISAAIASVAFSSYLGGQVYFDSRAWVLPESEVNNYFLSRQQDATRNAIQMLGQSKFSHQQLQNKSCSQIQEMLWQHHQINFNNFEAYYKRGRCVIKDDDHWFVDHDIPIFSQDKNYIEQWLATDE